MTRMQVRGFDKNEIVNITLRNFLSSIFLIAIKKDITNGVLDK